MLTERDFEQLRLERLHALEADHFRLSLRCEESPHEEAGLREEMAELRRRIEIHQDVIRQDVGRGDSE